MSKPASTTAQKTSSHPTRGAWAKGPPQSQQQAHPQSQSNSPSRAQSPAPTHVRRPSGLGQGVSLKDGVTVSRSNLAAAKQGSPLTKFGSFDDNASSSNQTPSQSSHVNGKSVPSLTTSPASSPASATPPPAPPHKPDKKDISKLFQMTSSASDPDSSSPAIRSAPLPQQHQQQPQQSQPQPAHIPYNSYPQSRPSQQNQSNSAPPPRSPVYPRQIPNGAAPRPPTGPAPPASQISPAVSSPRLAPHPPPHPQSAPIPSPSGLPPSAIPHQIHSWAAYYYDPNPYHHPHPHQVAYNPQWYLPSMQPPHHPPHHPPPPPTVPHPPPHSASAISPRNPPSGLPPSTPTQSQAVPAHHHHHPPSHSSSTSVSSPPPTPSTSSARLNANSSAFVSVNAPKQSKITFKHADGTDVDLSTLAKSSHAPPATPTTPKLPTRSPPTVSAQSSSIASNKKVPSGVRIETVEQRRKRMAEEEEKEKAEARAKADAEDRRVREQQEKEKKAKEEEDRKRKLEEEQAAKEAERLRKEQEEQERIRFEKEEKERIRKEQEEREQREAEERKRKEEEELQEKERQRIAEEVREQKRLAEEELERQRLQEEAAENDRLRFQAEAEATAVVALTEERQGPLSSSMPPVVREPTPVIEEGEIKETEESSTPPVIEEPKDKKETLRINTSPLLDRRRPDPLDLSSTKQSISPALPSALLTARNIEDIGSVPYPEGIQSPKPELNRNAEKGKFRYDRDFLLQFMKLCTEKPVNLPPLDAIGLEPLSEQSSLSMTRGGSGRQGRNTSGAIPPSRQASVGLGISSGLGKFGSSPFGVMGNFSSSKLGSSEERFLASTQRSTSVSGTNLPYGRPTPMQRTSSQGGPGGVPMSGSRPRSKRGEKRGDHKGSGQQASAFSQGQPGTSQGLSAEPVVPLQMSANRWDRKAMAGIDPDAPEVVDRKVKSLLNKLSMEKFASISDQIIDWANKSEKEKDGRTLIQVIRLVFEKATDEATWSEMYARLCRKMMERISPLVQDDGIKNAEGKPITGGQLFRKYLLNRCQEDFERGWVAKEATAAAAASKALEDEAVKAANEKGKDTGETVLYSDEYYAAQKAKRQGLGLIKFIGELFKLQMLTERIMHECVKKLLGNVDNPEEEEIESLCKLLTTVGEQLDTTKARAHMDVYFSRMKELTKSLNVSPRMQFMLQDVIELRERKWVSRNAVVVPTTIAQIHEAAAREKAAQEKEAYQRQYSMSRGGSRRGGERGEVSQTNADGWAVAGNAASRAPPKAGDLTNFGKISKNTAMSFGPSSVFAAGKDKGNKRETISRTNSSSNMFSMLQSAELPTEVAKPPEPQRKRLILQPRSKPAAADEQTQESATAKSESGSEEDEASVMEMSEEKVQAKIAEDVKELFTARNLDEAEGYFSSLPSAHHHKLVDKLVSTAVEQKESDAQLVADLFGRLAAAKDQLVSRDAFEEGLTPIAEIIEDLAIDAPKAYPFFAIMVKAVDFDEERRRRLADKSTDSERLLDSLSSS